MWQIIVELPDCLCMLTKLKYLVGHTRVVFYETSLALLLGTDLSINSFSAVGFQCAVDFQGWIGIILPVGSVQGGNQLPGGACLVSVTAWLEDVALVVDSTYFCNVLQLCTACTQLCVQSVFLTSTRHIWCMCVRACVALCLVSNGQHSITNQLMFSQLWWD